MSIPNGLIPSLLEKSPIMQSASNWWNLDVSQAALDDEEEAIIINLTHQRDLMTGLDPYLDFPIGDVRRSNGHPDMGGGGVYGIPYCVVDRNTPLVNVSFDNPAVMDEVDTRYPPFSGPIGYPIPEEAKTDPMYIEGNQDAHMLIIQKDDWWLYELSHARYSGGVWYATFGAIWDMNLNDIRPYDLTDANNDGLPDVISPTYGYSSTDAAGLAILPGLMRWDEVFQSPDPIRHAHRFAVRGTGLWVWPGMHTGNRDGKNASRDSNPNERVPTGFAVDGYDGLPLGLRLRLKASFNIATHLDSVGITPGTSPGNVTPPGAIWTNYQAMTRILECYKTYGLICADRGGHLYVQGTRDARWDSAVLNPVYHGKSATGFNGLNSSSFRVIKRGWSPPGQKPGDKEPQG